MGEFRPMQRTFNLVGPFLSEEINSLIIRTFRNNPSLTTITFYPNGDVVMGFRGEKNKE